MAIKTKVQIIADINSKLTTNGNGDISGADVNEITTDMFDTVNSYTGWAQYGDSTYTSGSPLAVNNARVKYTNDGLASTTVKTQLPSDVTDFWNASTNKITPQNAFDFYILRIDFKAKMNSANGFGVLQLDIGGGIGLITERTLSFPKGTSVETTFNISFPVYTGTTFLANGGELYFDTTAGSDNMDVYDLTVVIDRLYKGV